MNRSEDAARLLAELHVARDLTRAPERSSGADREPAARPSVGEIWAHVVRDPAEPISLAVTRAIRTDRVSADRYRAMLAGQAVAHAPFAAAAQHGAIASRRVGPFLLEVIADEPDAVPLLVIRGSPEGRRPRLIEAALGDETVRLDLPEPFEGTFTLALEPALAGPSLLGRLLADPASAVYLL